ncbi:MAG: ATP-binding cassette domain-containing protein, partial [Clostridiales bacterium]|nr:ATP-binding cassette domain-containing protein [Clostridiales bacterium]
MLEMRGISKRFGYVRALKQANITVQKAEIMALLGANGSGKSTMMKVLGGLIRADEGSIFLNGEEIRIERSNDVHKYKIAIGLQDLSLIPTLSVMDNILLGIEPRKGLLVDKKEASERIGPILSRLGITYDPSVLVSDLAPSEQSMVEIAKAIARDP